MRIVPIHLAIVTPEKRKSDNALEFMTFFFYYLHYPILAHNLLNRDLKKQFFFDPCFLQADWEVPKLPEGNTYDDGIS